MSFHLGYTETVLFSWWKTESVLGYLLTCFMIGLAAFLLEFLIGFRHRIEIRKRKQWRLLRHQGHTLTTPSSSKNSIAKVLAAVDGTCLHLLSLLLAYPLMLVIMTYNYGFMFFVILGSGIGYFLFSGMRAFGEFPEEDESDPPRESGCH